jgi:chromosome partitioning protein
MHVVYIGKGAFTTMKAQVFAFAHHKGGTGKTTSCINVAGFLAKAGKRVLVVDFDPHANATSGLGIDKNSVKESVRDALLRECGKPGVSLEEIVVRTDFPGINLAPANIGLAAVEGEMYRSERSFTILRDILWRLDGAYDYILVDTPPGHELFLVNGLLAADEVMLCVDVGVFALEGIETLKDVFRRMEKWLGVKVNVKLILLTKCRSGLFGFIFGDPAKDVERELLMRHGIRVVKIPFSTEVFRSQVEGRPISHFAPTSNVGQSYKKIAEEVMKNG